MVFVNSPHYSNEDHVAKSGCRFDCMLMSAIMKKQSGKLVIHCNLDGRQTFKNRTHSIFARCCQQSAKNNLLYNSEWNDLYFAAESPLIAS